jgi:hypothetical protein
MMKMEKVESTLFLGIAVLACALFIAACASPPTDEMNAARNALSQAQNDPDASTYAGNEVSQAADLVSQMESAAASRKYDQAKTLAAQAVSTAKKAISDGQAAAGAAKNNASTLLSQVKQQYSQTQTSLNNAKTGKLALDYDGMQKELSTAQTNIDAANVSFNNSRYNDATSTLQTVRTNLTSLQARIASGAQAVTRKK